VEDFLAQPRATDEGAALGLTAHANGEIEDTVASAARAAPGMVRFVLPDQGAWAGHQAWSGSPWVFKHDTWVHPNVDGHKQLAATVIKAMCLEGFSKRTTGLEPATFGLGSRRSTN
jgi:hypothetical protein